MLSAEASVMHDINHISVLVVPPMMCDYQIDQNGTVYWIGFLNNVDSDERCKSNAKKKHTLFLDLCTDQTYS